MPFRQLKSFLKILIGVQYDIWAVGLDIDPPDQGKEPIRRKRI